MWEKGQVGGWTRAGWRKGMGVGVGVRALGALTPTPTTVSLAVTATDGETDGLQLFILMKRGTHVSSE